ncbi:MAG: fumarate hydratase [Oscillospiraceae bacterium]|jgi:tartrate dehydratase alpha subunit/fumarate hydratase class I-like protein|nr:fumarate hydratase [Oscillospiraceae bacterium]
MQNVNELREKLRQEAATILPPALAILIECAFEGEGTPEAAEFLRGVIARFNECADKSLPLRAGEVEVYERADGDTLLVGLVSAETAEREVVINSDLTPPDHEFDALIAETVLLDDVGALCPILVGVGVADTEDEALELSRTALFRSADGANAKRELADAEKRILARLNSAGPGAGGFGGRHTAITVAIEAHGTGYIAISPGDYFTSYAKS